MTIAESTETRTEAQFREAIERVRASSFAATARPYAGGLAIAESEDYPSELNEEIRLHSATVAKINESLDACDRRLNEALAGVDFADDPLKLLSVVDEARIDGPLITQQLIRSWGNVTELAPQMEAAVASLVEPAEAFAARVLEDIQRKLVEIGSGPEASPTFSANPTAAGRVFEQRARFENVHARKAFDAAANLRTRASSLRELRQRATRQLDATRRFANDWLMRALSH